MKNITCITNANKTTMSPSKIVCIGRNYVEHAKELGNAIPSTPIIFLKPNSSISSTLTSSSISLFEGKERSTNSEIESHHYESELCFLIKNNAISAVGFGLDLTRRETQQKLKEKGLPWERAKVFNGAAVFSHFVPIDASDIANLSLSLEINGTVVQQGDVSMMLFKPSDIIDEVLTFLSLEDNDIIMTGTPAGVGVINKGDQFKGSVYLNDNKLIEQIWVGI
jgi:2-keto-4-pentenoate hydratase/2-oxohepta-3-ene-1,7-dioic acid hydratase in catechol pathway